MEKPDDTSRKMLATAAGELTSMRSETEQWADVEKYSAIFDKADPDNKSGLGEEVVFARTFAAFLGGKDASLALKTIREGEKRYAESERMDRMMFLEASILHEKGEHEAGVAIWKKVAEKYPDSEWGKRAKRALER